MAENTILIQTDLDNSKVQKSIKEVEGSFDKLASAATKAFAAYFSFQSVKKVIHAAMEQEDAINRLNQSLRAAGTYSLEASKSMQEFADRMQETTILQDEAVLSGLALARNMTKTNEEAQKLTQAAIDLSTATGKDLPTAITLLGKTLTGSATGLKLAGINTKEFTAEQLKAGAAIDALAARFEGVAAGQVNTFSGAITQAGNNFNSFLASLGSVITQSPVLINSIKMISDYFAGLAKTVKEFVPIASGWIDAFLLGLVEVDRYIALFVVVPMNALKEVITSAMYRLVAVITYALDEVVNIAAKIMNYISPNSEIGQAINKLHESLGVSADEASLQADAAYQRMWGAEKIAEINTFYDQVQAKMQETTDKAIVNSTNTTEAHKNMLDGLTDFIADKLSFIGAVTKEVSLQVQKSLTQGFSKGMQAAGAALVNGGNAMKEFGKAMLGTLGDVAIQYGEFYIGLGIASYNYAQVAAGAALVMLGGAIKALAAGGGGGASAGGGAGGAGVAASVAGPSDNLGNQDQLEKQKQTNITVNVEGNILDRRQTGLELAAAIQESFDTQGIVFSSGAVA